MACLHPLGANVLGLNVPNVLEPIGLEAGGRLIWSSLLLFGGIGAVVVMARRPKSPEPTTWAQTILGVIGFFALMTLAYGIVPHEWLNFASAHLKWGEDTFFVKNNSVLPFNIDRRAGADTVATLLYVVFAVVQVLLFAMWQKRPVAEAGADAPAEGRKAAGTSRYGRPVTTAE